MMHTLKWVLFLAVPAMLVAADPPGDQIAPDDVTMHLILLRQKSVQDELKLTPELTKKIMDFTNREYEAFLKALQLGEKEREPKLEELEKENQKFLTDNLNPAQRKRLDQITMQVTGLQQLTRPDVVKLLNLTEAQQQKFKEMQQAARKELEDIIGAKDRQGRNEKLAKLRADIDKNVEAVLTQEQKEKARELVGEPFKGQILLEESESAPK
jgi:Spy/CpxP family protein refolding chaperone